MGTIQEVQPSGYGSSLPVPSVQEIVRNDAQSIPDRFVKNVMDRPKTSEISPISDRIPVIDLSLLSKGDEGERKKLDIACQEWGFFHITNHGADEVIAKAKEAVAGFFDLPLSQKKKYAMPSNDVQGYGQAYVISDDQDLDWNDILFLMTFPDDAKNMKYWPSEVPGFKEAVEEYTTVIQKVAEEIFANLSLAMGLERHFIKQLHGNMKHGTRMNYYPECSRPELVLGVSPHSDSGSITLLIQDDDLTALQIKHEGLWVPVEPLPNTIVVNIGDCVEAWSNGKYKSIEHRAITSVERSRISIATFMIADENVELNPIRIGGSNDPMLYKDGVTLIEYVRYTLSKKMEGKSPNIQYLILES